MWDFNDVVSIEYQKELDPHPSCTKSPRPSPWTVESPKGDGNVAGPSVGTMKSWGVRSASMVSGYPRRGTISEDRPAKIPYFGRNPTGQRFC